jgi:phosphohistidine phosphatase
LFQCEAGAGNPGRDRCARRYRPRRFTDALYNEDAAGYLAIIKENGARGSLLVIGHNPMMEDLAMAIAGGGDEKARAALNYGFPTSGLAVVRFEGGLCNAAPGAGYLEAFLTPADM